MQDISENKSALITSLRILYKEQEWMRRRKTKREHFKIWHLKVKTGNISQGLDWFPLPPASATGSPKLTLSLSTAAEKANGEAPRGVADRLPVRLRGVLAVLFCCCFITWSVISCEQAWWPWITAQSSGVHPGHDKTKTYTECWAEEADT